MRIERVTEVDDPRIAVYRDLPKSNLTRPSGLFVAEGWLVVERLLASDFEVASLLVDDRRLDEYAGRLPDGPPVYLVPHERMNEIVGFRFHRGILACGRRRPSPSLDELLQRVGPRMTAVAAVDVNDPENLGALLRTSAAFGAELVLVTQRSADPFSRRVLRTSMGSVFKLPLRITDDVRTDLDRLRREWGVELAAAVLDEAAEPLRMARRAPRFGLLMGNEGHGLPADLVERCDRRVTIPMASGVDSLNVSVAAGIVLHHFFHAES